MATRVTDQFINRVTTVLDHLLHYGEISSAEVAALRGMEVVTFLEQDGWLIYQGDTKVVTRQLLERLPMRNLTELTRHICFNHPGYRRYLIVIAAAELARRGLEGAMVEVESWLVQELPHLAREINQLLDHLEKEHLSSPLKGCSPGEVLPGFQAILTKVEDESEIDLTTWDKALLGVSGNREAVFQAILARQALAPVQHHPASITLTVLEQPISESNNDLAHPQGRPVFFPPLDQVEGMGLEIEGGSIWIRRMYIYSSLPLLDCNKTMPLPAETELVWQEAFSQHPVSWLLIQLGVYQYVQQAAGSGLARLKLIGVTDEESRLIDIHLSLDEQLVGSFLALLPELLAVLGWHLVLPFGQAPPAALDRLLVLMRQAHVLTETPQGEFVLDESFTRTLFERSRYQQLNKGVKRYRERLIQKLEDILAKQMNERNDRDQQRHVQHR